MTTNKVLETAPDDPKSFVYVMFYWLGIGTLLPWNFFISVSEYWKYKYRWVNETYDQSLGKTSMCVIFSRPYHSNYFISSLDESISPFFMNDMQRNWGSHLAVASMVPNVTMLLLNAAFGHRFKTQPRLLVSLILVILLFIFTDVMVKINTDSWQDTFYIVTLISVVCININAAIFQGIS